jgi:transposase
MRKVKEVLRLRFGLGLLQNQIARSCSIGQATVHRYLQKAAAAGLSWPLPEDLDDRQLEELLFPVVVGRPSQVTRPLPDFADIRRQLQTHKHLTLQLIWEEYRQAQGDGYGYSRFCELYERWGRKQDVVLRQEHRAGEKMFVDWAGDSVPIYDRHSAEVTPASLFVAVLGASTYTYTGPR